MSHLFDEIRQHPLQVGLGGPMQAVVSTAPADESSPLGVMLQQFAQSPTTHNGKPATIAQLLTAGAPEFQGCAWAPRYTITGSTVTVRLPSVGDPCLVVLDDYGQAWVVGWWPFGGLT